MTTAEVMLGVANKYYKELEDVHYEKASIQSWFRWF